MRFLLAVALLASQLPFAASARVVSAAPLKAAPAADPTPTPSATPSSTPTPDPELDQAKREAQLAEERKKKAQAEKDEAVAERDKLKAELEPFGDPTKVTIPTGGVTTDQAGFVEAQMLAQEAARDITAKLTYLLCTRTANQIDTLVIYNSADLSSLAIYRSMSVQLESFKREFATKENEKTALLSETNPRKFLDKKSDPTESSDPLTAIAIPGIATGLIKSVAELVNLFRTETSFQTKAVTIPEDMVVSYLVNNLNSTKKEVTFGNNGQDVTKQCTAKRPTVYYPALFPPDLFVDPKDTELIKQLSDISVRRSTAVKSLGEIDERIAVLTEIADKLEAKPKKVKQLAEKAEEKQKLVQQLDGASSAAAEEIKKKIKTLEGEIETLNKDLTSLDERIALLVRKPTTEKPQPLGREEEEIVVNTMKKKDRWLALLNDLKAKTKVVVDATDLITSKLNTPDEATRLTPLAQLLRAERLATILKTGNTYVLRVAVTANGTTKIKKNLFVDAKVRHTAGVNLVFQLFDKDGKVEMADSMQYFYSYKSAGEVRDEVLWRNRLP